MTAATLQDLLLERWLRRRSTTYWTTRDGIRIPISKMSDIHIERTVAMLLRKKEEEEDIEFLLSEAGWPDNM